jgi:hypothetical protein
MIIENSIESRILELQKKKKALFDSTVGKDMSSLVRVKIGNLADRGRFPIFICFVKILTNKMMFNSSGLSSHFFKQDLFKENR